MIKTKLKEGNTKLQNEISDLQKYLNNFTYTKEKSKNQEELVTYYTGLADLRSAHPEVLLEKGVLKISNKFSDNTHAKVWFQ